MKNISVLTAFAVFAAVAMICGISAPVGPGASVEAITASIIVPVAQELPIQGNLDLAQN
jgi:hypothetical protein